MNWHVLLIFMRIVFGVWIAVTILGGVVSGIRFMVRRDGSALRELDKELRGDK